MTTIQKDTFIDTIDKEQGTDWCHLCRQDDRFLISFQSLSCSYTRLCRRCVGGLYSKMMTFIDDRFEKELIAIKNENENDI